ncbi:2-amino-4-hydroxy-6-hydroxymethyldihydropteridine diphosphokinase [Agromyces terreus]|uniref:2-amino-4-hydroxy-6-hydroxymethyldihydropteridine diphosphokinase n=1 Tax=Agromyces terreus TaxID=424795 RepID=A0A9X2H0P3_9MICO|nr:2-amino-4-hydroxy-6-hydroxymethyldihydropteridine diphosphokinase [Agromyces terreus]MCP2371016.1 2-amino-4-hydroxy-6-hydroxymethyldihydropteridine diphosphokinase [Agromyces terreus]
MSRAVIAFGANLGDRETTVAEAMRELAELDGVELVAISPVYETPALTDAGVDRDAPGYLNGVVVLETTAHTPHQLLAALHDIEAAHGRQRLKHWGDRTLDLDLIDVDGLVIDDTGLQLPHPRAWQRAFVLQPWLDVDPDAVIPGRGRVADLRAQAHDEVTRR